MVHFYSGKISTKTGGSFADYVKRITGDNKPVQKTAAAVADVKTAEAEPDEAETSGQPQAEAKLVNRPEKEEGKAQNSGADNSEAETSGQPQAEAKLVNHPKVVEESDKSETKEATKKEDKDDETCKECEQKPCICAETKKETKEAGKDNSKNFGDKKAEPFGKKDEKKDEEKDAAAKPGFVRIAKLNDDTRQWLRDYWRNLYPADYVEAMLADK